MNTLRRILIVVLIVAVVISCYQLYKDPKDIWTIIDLVLLSIAFVITLGSLIKRRW